MVDEKVYYQERNNSIHRLKFRNCSQVNLRQSAGKYLYNVRIVDSTLKRVDNTTRKEVPDFVGHIVRNVRISMLHTLTMGNSVAVAIREGLYFL